MVFLYSEWAGGNVVAVKFVDQIPRAVDLDSYGTESFEQLYLTAWLLTVAGVLIRGSPI